MVCDVAKFFQLYNTTQHWLHIQLLSSLFEFSTGDLKSDNVIRTTHT